MYENHKSSSNERRLRMTKRILKIISELAYQSLTVSELADKMGVSTRTIRRDLDVLIAELVVFRVEDNKFRRNPSW